MTTLCSKIVNLQLTEKIKLGTQSISFSLMKLNANGLSHLGLRVTNLARAKRFYVDTLGCQLVREIDGAVLVNVYGTLIALYGADSHSPRNDHFDPFRVGLDHLALAVEDPGI